MTQKIKRFFVRLYRQLICSHEDVKPLNITMYNGNVRTILHGKECKECGKKWWK